MAPRVGFEPTTLRLTAECSTTELSRNSSYNYFSITYLFGIWQPLTFPGSFPPSIISRLCLNQPVRNGKGCVPQTHHHQKFLKAFSIPSKLNIEYHHQSRYGCFHFSSSLTLLNFIRSSPRPISIGQLNTLPCLHLQPIYLVVFKGSYLLAQWEI